MFREDTILRCHIIQDDLLITFHDDKANLIQIDQAGFEERNFVMFEQILGF